MSSLTPGYEYDIFISYRHNDNRSGWVTEFVAALQEELGGAIKYPVSIYFDKNPQDGLLETHNVDKSLEGKLKSLIFIPIISQTYCDPKSFAWEHEFRLFNRLSADDQFGRHVKLVNGNVASRGLPVLIHDLDAEDRSDIENETGEVLRGVEFIYKEPGVNRPLKITDNKSDNQRKTDYRNQVNKVANAVKELLVAMKSGPVQVQRAEETFQSKGKRMATKTIVLAAVFLLFLIGGYFLYSSAFSDNTDELEKSVAVLAFADMSPGKDQEWFSDGLSEEILNSLAHLRELKVTARTSSFYYKGKDVPLNEIAEKLGVANIVEGSVRRNGQQLRITAQLIRASDGFHIWSNTYDRTADDVFRVQTEIAESIARALLNELTAKTKSSLNSSGRENVQAYEYYLKGTWAHDRYASGGGDLKDFRESERYLLKSISLDTAYAEAYGALADLYDSRSSIPAEDERRAYRKKRDSLIQIGLKLDPNSPQIIAVNGWSFLKSARPNLDSAYHYIRKAYLLYPNTDYILAGIGGFYDAIGIKDAAIKYYKRGSERDPLHGLFLSPLANAYLTSGRYHDAQKHLEKALELDQFNPWVTYLTGLVAANEREPDKLEEQIKAALQATTDPIPRQWVKTLQALSLAMQGKNSEALALAPKDLSVLSMLKMKKEFIFQLDSVSSLPINRFDPHALRQNPMYDFVRNEVQFKAIVGRVQKKYDSLLARYPPPD